MENKTEELNVVPLFSCPVFMMDKPEFLKVTRKVSKKFLDKRKKEVDLNPVYPAYMTEAINYDPEMLEFANFVAQTAWNILDAQGYAMNDFKTFFTEMWTQEHHQNSSMDKHIHGNGSLITGFYFLDVPQDSSRVIFHEPKDAKTITNLPEKDPSEATHASSLINFIPKAGQLMLTNSWLPHSFTKNESKKPLRFIHFNIAVVNAPQQPTSCEKPAAEVV